MAQIAARERDPRRRARTVEEADDAVRDACLTRDLILFLVAVGGQPTPEELNEPE